MLTNTVHIKTQFCVGCGLCREYCPREAIRLVDGYAEIDQSRCDRCGVCIDTCPQGAIVMLVPTSVDELTAMVDSLRERTDDLITAIETIQKRRHR